ncbi:MAG: YceD family protein [Gammaproteobacteria bacterium]
MPDRLPELIDPLSFADKGSELKGSFHIDSLGRLADQLFEREGVVEVELLFDKEGALPFLEGRIKAVLSLRCQNCLQPLKCHIDKKIRLGIVTSMAEADRLPDNYEPLLIDEKKIVLKDIIEDELLLELPAFPKHTERCYDNTGIFGTATPPRTEYSDSNNPFSILAKLKKSGD